jgi:hypothetical protein
MGRGHDAAFVTGTPRSKGGQGVQRVRVYYDSAVKSRKQRLDMLARDERRKARPDRDDIGRELCGQIGQTRGIVRLHDTGRRTRGQYVHWCLSFARRQNLNQPGACSERRVCRQRGRPDHADVVEPPAYNHNPANVAFVGVVRSLRE